MDTPLHYRCHPGALRVLVPREVAEKMRADEANATCVIGGQEGVARSVKDAVVKE
jgi:hypothetical protein